MLSDNNPVTQGDRIPDIFDIMHILKRHKTLMAQLMAISVSIGFAVILLLPNYYKAYATLVLNDHSLNMEDFRDVLAGAKLDNMSVQTEVKILTSSSLALKTIDATGLDKNPLFASPSMDRLEVANKFMKSLSVEPQGASRAIEIAFKARDPQLAADITNAHANAYLEAKVELKKQQVEQLGKWLGAKVRAENTTAAVSDDVVNSPLIQKLKEQASAISQQLGSLRATYGPNHPKVIAASSQLAQVNQAIARETSTIRESIESNGTASQSQISFAWPDATLVSPAVAPIKPAPPGKKLMMLLVVVFSGCLTLGIVFALEIMRKGVRNFEDIRRFAQKPLGIIPLVENPARMLHSQENFSYREAIKRVYMSALLNSKARAILVTSAMPEEGRTTFVMSLAHYLQSIGHKVAVIDADFLRPSLSQLTRQPAGAGFSDVLAGRSTLANAITTDDKGIAVLRAGSHALATPDVLRPDRLHTVLEQLKREYAFVLVDSGPLLAHSEADAIASQADGIIVITEWLKTSQQNMSNMFATLRALSTPVLGVVINKVDIGKYKNISPGSDFLLPKAANAA